MHSLNLECQCGKVQGVAKHITPKQATRVICYCKSCQAFAHFLRPNGTDIIDNNGGTDIYQTAPVNVQFTQGTEHIKGIRLSDKGLHRWYADCCKTPIGNTVSAKMPFIGLIHNIINDNQTEQALGPVRSRVNIAGAYGDMPATTEQLMPQNRYLFKFMLKLLGWKFSGKGKTSPFYQADGKRIYPLDTLRQEPE